MARMISDVLEKFIFTYEEEEEKCAGVLDSMISLYILKIVYCFLFSSPSADCNDPSFSNFPLLFDTTSLFDYAADISRKTKEV